MSILDFFKTYKVFFPYDIDFSYPKDINFYYTNEEIVANMKIAPSDNGEEGYKK